jgi:hypothetical protein
MTKLGKLVVRIGLLSLLSALPLAAQVGDGVDFTTAFAFYAGGTKLPAGSPSPIRMLIYCGSRAPMVRSLRSSTSYGRNP